MILYRLAHAAFADDLSGTGAKLYGGRWNSVGFPAIYTTETISLAALEILVHTGKRLLPPDYRLLKLELPDSLSNSIITKTKLKKEWKDDVGYTQFMGSEFIKNAAAIALKVPSAIIDEENNIVLNPLHADFKKIKIKGISTFAFDKRFFLVDE